MPHRHSGSDDDGRRRHRRPSPPTFDDFEEAYDRKRGRTEAPRRRVDHHDVITVRCSCCSKQVDLRTIHCSDCCDDDKRRRQGKLTTQDSSRHAVSRRSIDGAESERRNSSSGSLKFVAEGRAGQDDRGDQPLCAALGAERLLRQLPPPTSLEESEDLVDLSISLKRLPK